MLDSNQSLAVLNQSQTTDSDLIAQTLLEQLSPNGSACLYELIERLDNLGTAATSGSASTLDLSRFNRRDRLAIINYILEGLNLKPLAGLGDFTKGQIEFIGINKIKIDPFVCRFDFMAIGASGKVFNHLCLFNANTAAGSGAIAVVIINNDSLLLIEQFRPTLGHVVYDFPKGFPEAGNLSAIKGLRTLELELEQETGIKLCDLPQEDIEITLFSDVIENTGTSNITNDIFILRLRITDQSKLQALKNYHTFDDEKSGINVKLIPICDAFRYIRDNHSLAALGSMFCLNAAL